MLGQERKVVLEELVDRAVLTCPALFFHFVLAEAEETSF